MFWDKHMALRTISILSRRFSKLEDEKVKERPFAEGSKDLTCARAFHL
jgi:hypothetical protein